MRARDRDPADAARRVETWLHRRLDARRRTTRRSPCRRPREDEHVGEPRPEHETGVTDEVAVGIELQGAAEPDRAACVTRRRAREAVAARWAVVARAIDECRRDDRAEERSRRRGAAQLLEDDDQLRQRRSPNRRTPPGCAGRASRAARARPRTAGAPRPVRRAAHATRRAPCCSPGTTGRPRPARGARQRLRSPWQCSFVGCDDSKPWALDEVQTPPPGARPSAEVPISPSICVSRVRQSFRRHTSSEGAPWQARAHPATRRGRVARAWCRNVHAGRAEQLVDAAVELWTERGFEAGVEETTVEEIVQAAGVTKGTFYFHFAHKEDILLEVGWGTSEALFKDVTKALAQDRSVDDVLDGLLVLLARRISATPRARGRPHDRRVLPPPRPRPRPRR